MSTYYEGGGGARAEGRAGRAHENVGLARGSGGVAEDADLPRRLGRAHHLPAREIKTHSMSVYDTLILRNRGNQDAVELSLCDLRLFVIKRIFL